MPKNGKKKSKNSKKIGIYLQTVLGLVAIKQKRKFSGTAHIVYRFNLFTVSEYY